MTCFTPVDKNNCFSNVYIREVVRSEIQKAAECFEGDSAYAVAVKNGYVGTEDAWLASLGGTIADIKAIGLEAGSAPSANLGGTPRNRIINLGIPKGDKGEAGIQGIPGPTGLSAYDVAVANGFDGTKTDWLLAIKGEKGDVGPEGPEGKEGKSTYELSVDYGYSGSEREWLTGIVNDTELMSNLNEDLLSIGEAANGDENTTVVTRTGETYPSAKKAISDGITTLFENGGLPAEPFETKAQMEVGGAELADGQLAIVYNDTADNGLYVKTAGSWVKSKYDKADRVSPSLQGVPTAPTAPLFSKDTTLANTSFVDRAVEYATTNSTGINLTEYSESEYVVSEAQFRKNLFNVFGNPSVDEVTLVVPSSPQRQLWVNNTSIKPLKIKVTGSQSSLELSRGLQAYAMVGGTSMIKANSQKADINSPALLGVPTAPTPPTSSNDGTLSTTKFVQDLVGEKFNINNNYVAGINLSNLVGDIVLSDFHLNSGVLNIFGTPEEPVTLVFPDDTEKTYLIRMGGLPSTVVNLKFATRTGVATLVTGSYHLTVSSGLGFTIPYGTKADLRSPTFIGTPLAPTPTRNARGMDIATTAFVGNIAQGVIIENITDDSTDVSSTSGHTICLRGTLTKDVTLTINAAKFGDNIGINIDNKTEGGKTVFIKGNGQSYYFVELRNGEGKSIYTRAGVAYSLDNQSSSLPVTPATKTSLGVVKIGSGINVDSSGTISVTSSGGGSGTNLSYNGKFKVGSDYNVGDVVEHGSGIYQVVSNVTNAQKPYDDVSFQKIAHNYQAGEKGSVTVLSNEYETYSNAYNIPYKLSKSGTLIFNRRTSPLRYSKDLGRTWLENPPLFTPPEPASTIDWVNETDDGELLIAVRQYVEDAANIITVHKSQGWDGINGNTPEWTQVFGLERVGAHLAEWGVSPYKNYVVMIEYGSQKGVQDDIESYAKYGYLSKDYGKTWETIFNLDDHTTTNGVHLHGACFDPYWNRIWISHGDGAYTSNGQGTNGLYYSDDLGKTWTSALETQDPGANFSQSVGIVALPTCILFSSDSYPNGVQRIDRAQGRTPVKGFYEVESAYLVPDSSTTGLSQILTTGHKAEWLPNAPYVWGFAAESRSGKTGCVLSWDGWEFHEVWVSDVEYTRSTGVKAVMGITPENTIILSGTGEGEGGDDSTRWSRTFKVSLDV